jgi:hypothetical protein
MESLNLLTIGIVQINGIKANAERIHPMKANQ